MAIANACRDHDGSGSTTRPTAGPRAGASSSRTASRRAAAGTCWPATSTAATGARSGNWTACGSGYLPGHGLSRACPMRSARGVSQGTRDGGLGLPRTGHPSPRRPKPSQRACRGRPPSDNRRVQLPTRGQFGLAELLAVHLGMLGADFTIGPAESPELTKLAAVLAGRYARAGVLGGCREQLTQRVIAPISPPRPSSHPSARERCPGALRAGRTPAHVQRIQ